MFKSVLIIIFVIVILMIIRTVLQRQKQPGRKTKPIDTRDTVQCQHCKTYFPRDDAIFKDEMAFCSSQHLDDWNHTT